MRQSGLNGWFLKPEPRAAGNQAWSRIVFSLFYLWYLSSHHAALLAEMPEQHRISIPLAMPLYAGSPLLFSILESILAGSLVLLLLGCRTRPATLSVLILGTVLEAQFTGMSREYGTLFLTFYIPLFMFISGHWGDVYSVDSRDRQVAPEDSSGRYAVVSRAILVVLSALFFSSAVSKVFPGNWLTEPHGLHNLFLKKSLVAAELGLPSIPWLVPSPMLGQIGAILIIVFETIFCLSLWSRPARRILLPLALIFHAANAIVLTITFTPVMIVYALFVDWERWLPKRARKTFPNSSWATTMAIVLAVGWNSVPAFRDIFNLFGLLNWYTVWLPVLPFAVASLLKGIWELRKSPARAADQKRTGAAG